MKRTFAVGCCLAITLIFSACDGADSRVIPAAAALATIRDEDLVEHIQILASNQFEGRLPGSKGEEMTTRYLAEHFKSLGLLPGNSNGTYFQEVPLVGITADPAMQLVFSSTRGALKFRYGEEFMAWTKRVTEEASIEDTEVVFVGYGVVAPEFDWNDFKGVDVQGKTLIVLVNDPPLPDPNDSSKLAEAFFGGKAMTYYGRWTYKYEMAAEKGALGCFVIHETGPAGYPWEVVEGSWKGEQFDLVTQDRNMSRAEVEGWLTYESAQALFDRAGYDLNTLKEAAMRRDFTPLPLGVRTSLTIHNNLRTIDSHNVVARLEGNDLIDEQVIYMAHWDHLGKDPTLEGDSIYNGAVDNATGTAGLLELAEAFRKLATPPRRSILFLAVTAEEQGLLGSRYYAENPIYPLERTLAAINIDGLNELGRTRDITLIGLGNSTLDDLIEAITHEQGRVVRPDPQPEKGFFYRSDHFEFAKQGVPAVYLNEGVDFVGRPDGWGLQMREQYTRERYHKPSDEFDPNWDLTGMVSGPAAPFPGGLSGGQR